MGTWLRNWRVIGSSPARTTAEGAPEQGPEPYLLTGCSKMAAHCSLLGRAKYRELTNFHSFHNVLFIYLTLTTLGFHIHTRTASNCIKDVTATGFMLVMWSHLVIIIQLSSRLKCNEIEIEWIIDLIITILYLNCQSGLVQTDRFLNNRLWKASPNMYYLTIHCTYW